jgi:hypothetical protein
MWTFDLDLMFFSWHFQIPHLRPAEFKRSRLPRNRRTVNRPFGGVLSGTSVRERSANIAGYIDKWKLRIVPLLVTFYCYAGSSVLSWLKSRRLSRRFLKFRKPRARQPQSRAPDMEA